MSYKLSASTLKRVVIVAMALALLPMTIVSAEDLPQPQMIINKYIKATGGEDAYKGIKNRTMKGSMMIVAMGMSGTMTVTVEPPNSKSVMALDGFGEFLSGIKDGTPWSSNMMEGDSIQEGDAAKAALRGADLQEWLNWQNYYASAETLGEEAVGDATAWKVALTTEAGDTSEYWFDKDSGLILQSYGPGLGGPSTTTFSDYREVGGIQIAHSMSSEGANGPVEITWESIEINTSIDAEVFGVPDAIAALMGDEGSETK